MGESPWVALDRIASGARGIVRELQGGADFQGRLAGMGLTRGTPIEMLQNPRHGPVLVRAHDARIALGRGEAAKVLVEETDGPPPPP
jgi:ferrous iron transport protein A